MAITNDTGFEIFMVFLSLYIAGQLAWSIRDIAKLPKSPKRPKSDNRDVRLMWSTFRTARHSGASLADSIRAATDAVEEFQRTGTIPQFRLPDGRAYDTPPPSPSSQVLGMARAILLNSVTIAGVFMMRWPVGTGLALYWSETVLSSLLLAALLMIWRHGRGVETRRGGPGEILLVSLVFSAAHFLFLFFFLEVILPRYSVADRFDRASFQQGLILIGVILAVDFAVNALLVRERTSSDLQRSAQLYLQRIGVLHLTIIFGMLALAIFGSPRAFFAVFAGLKMLVDLTRRL